MKIQGHRIKEKISVERFFEIIKEHEKIECSNHAFFRLSEGQRKVFICKELIKYLTCEKPVLVGLQHNGNYAAFYNYGIDILRIIINILPNKIEIITFYIIEKVPKI